MWRFLWNYARWTELDFNRITITYTILVKAYHEKYKLLFVNLLKWFSVKNDSRFLLHHTLRYFSPLILE